MALVCPRCSRNLSDSADPADAPLFCMFCGQRLRSDSGVAPPAAVMPDPGLTIDAPTHSFNQDGTPEEAPAPRVVESQPRAVGEYDLVRFLGAGGMGTVYEAENRENGQRVAVKLLSGKLTSNPTSVERFRQEGRVASQITHPHCVFVYRADADAGRPYIVMELMPGKTLKDLVDLNGPMPVAEAMTRILDVIAGLTEAHRLGVIHRDVKPSNCFLTSDDRVKVGDFGLSKSLTPDQDNQKQITQSGAFLGTVLFASPEQIRGESVGYESDVYAVCGTLYYLLTGRAPYQHESLTATLAKAVSEPPPPIRRLRPDVPAELERVILRGLERDRDRRWQSLDDLDDALRSLLPANQRPARPRSLILAYLVDTLILQFAIVPAELLRQSILGFRNINVDLFEMTWLAYVITFLYFLVGEGIWGTTPGKRLMRIRVSRVGETGPPGLVAATIRTLVFNLIWTGVLSPAEFFSDYLSRGMTIILAVPIMLACMILLLRQFAISTHGYRGVHDFLSGCRAIQRPRAPERLRLIPRFPNPLDRFQPTTEPLPGHVGGFGIRGKLCDLADAGEIWVAEDRSLGRRILIRVSPPGSSEFATGDPITRPTRLRIVGQGTFVWQSQERSWTAYLAPSGAPLVDVVHPDKPLTWLEARSILDQLAQELAQAEQDGTSVDQPRVEQVWVEPGGRLQILECLLPVGATNTLAPPRHPSKAAAHTPPVPDTPLDFVRRIASLMLEGHARRDGPGIRAPIPAPASRILLRLYTGQYRSMDEFRADLVENQSHPASVNSSLRATHLAVQAPLVSIGLFTMFLLTGLCAFIVALTGFSQIRLPKEVQALLADPAEVARIRTQILRRTDLTPDARDTMLAQLDPKHLTETRQRLDANIARMESENQGLLRTLTRPERVLLDNFMDIAATAPTGVTQDQAINLSLRMARHDRSPGPDDLREAIGVSLMIVVAVWPVIWALFVVAFRGGISSHLAGVTLVRSDGQPAGRIRCGLRELVLWLPLTLTQLAVIGVMMLAPEYVVLRSAVWLTSVLLLPLYLWVALRNPTQGPHDRLLGTHLMPA